LLRRKNPGCLLEKTRICVLLHLFGQEDHNTFGHSLARRFLRPFAAASAPGTVRSYAFGGLATIANVTQGRDLDPDGFPVFPPLPGAHEVPIRVRTLPRLVASLSTGVLAADGDQVQAMVVFLERQPVDGMAIRAGRRVTGPDALDEIADVPVEQLAFCRLPPDLAGVLGSYFLPTEVRGVPAASVLPEAFLRSLARPDTRGCVLVRAGEETGLVFLAAGAVVTAVRAPGGATGGLEVVSELLSHPGARIWARLGPLPEGFAPPAGAAGEPPPAEPRLAERPVEQPAPAPPAEPEPAAPPPPAPAPPSPVVGPASAEPEPSPAAPPAMDEVLERILQGARERLGRHSAAVEDVFCGAPRTAEGLRSAAESVRGLRIRLVSQATLEGIADEAVAVLGQGP
jgi:hypothetical protein